MEHEALLRKYRKKPLARQSDFPEKLSLSREEIKKIIPHREPFLLIDTLTGLDLAGGMIMGRRFLSPEDPVFQGHFPGQPLYPGSLQLEMTGQLGLCLHYFITRNTASIAGDAAPLPVRATRIIGACFLEPLPPGSETLLMVKKLSCDQYFGTVIGQVLLGEKICSVSISEVFFME